MKSSSSVCLYECVNLRITRWILIKHSSGRLKMFKTFFAIKGGRNANCEIVASLFKAVYPLRPQFCEVFTLRYFVANVKVRDAFGLIK